MSKLLRLPDDDEEDQITVPPVLLASLSVKMGEEVTTEYLLGLNQHAASLKIDLQNLNLLSQKFSEGASVREKARLASLSIKDSHAGDWLTVIPSPGLGLLLRPPEFVAAARYRLGHQIFTSDGPSPGKPAAGRASALSPSQWSPWERGTRLLWLK